MIDVEATFKKYHDSFLQGACIGRRDMAAFQLLDKLVPGNGTLISAAEHDMIFLDIKPLELAKVATEDDIRRLSELGVRYDTEYECLSMFV